MDWLTFIAEIVRALAWPVTALIIFLALRRPLFRLIPLIQRFRFLDFELDFGSQVHELAASLGRELPERQALSGERKQLREHLSELAHLSPRAVVLEAWLQLEKAAIEAARRRDLKLTSREMRSPILLGYYLEEAGILDESMSEVYHRLRNLRNAAAHAADFSYEPEAALEYADLALRLAELLERV
jgi:hypothetical protein